MGTPYPPPAHGITRITCLRRLRPFETNRPGHLAQIRRRYQNISTPIAPPRGHFIPIIYLPGIEMQNLQPKEQCSELSMGGDWQRNLLRFLDNNEKYRSTRGETEWQSFVETCKNQEAIYTAQQFHNQLNQAGWEVIPPMKKASLPDLFIMRARSRPHP